jgi:tRNA(His) 5'-end guanylyltransferase
MSGMPQAREGVTMQDSLGDRMKANYEDRQRHYLTRRMPVIVRVDGKAFHTLTRRLRRPFDVEFMVTMLISARNVAEEMQNCKTIYVQSDEASFLLTDYDTLTTESWFDYNQQKIVSIAAGLMSSWFYRDSGLEGVFDARAFNMPREEVSNYFLWRARDWHRNSVQMYARKFFSDKQLHLKKIPAIHEMLHGIGKNWATDLDDRTRNGTFIVRGGNGCREFCNVLPTYESVSALIEPLLLPREEAA